MPLNYFDGPVTYLLQLYNILIKEDIVTLAFLLLFLFLIVFILNLLLFNRRFKCNPKIFFLVSHPKLKSHPQIERWKEKIPPLHYGFFPYSCLMLPLSLKTLYFWLKEMVNPTKPCLNSQIP